MTAKRAPVKRQRAKAPGRQTGRQSSLLEACVESLHMIGFRVYGGHPEFEKASGHGDRYVVRSYPHESLYGTPGRKEALIVAPAGGRFAEGEDGLARIIVEAKYQDVSGSTDEKLPYIWEAFLVSKTPNWIAVLDGRYWTKDGRGKLGADWLARRAKFHTPEGRTFRVTDRKGFIDLAKTTWSPS